MLPEAGDLPVGDGWSYEVDWAGVRLLADVDEGVLTLLTAEGDDVTARFPEFAGLVEAVPDGLLDGEAVMLDGGSPSADALGERLRVDDARRARELARERPAVFMVYDVVRLYGVPLDPRPHEDRRSVLSRLDLSRATRIQVSPVYDDGPALLAGVLAQHLSGVVAKRRGSAYRSGEAGGDWIRVAADTVPAASPSALPDLGPGAGNGLPAAPAVPTEAPTEAPRRPRHAKRTPTPQHDTLF